jgi:tetratricopeptide (TPR) repeat protein
MKSIRIKPDNLECLRAVTYSFTYPKLLEYAKCQELCSEANKKNPDDPELLHLTWVIKGRKVDSEKDEKLIKKAIDSKSNFLLAKIDYAHALTENGDEKKADRALTQIEEVLDINKEIALAYMLKGIIYARRERLTEAEHELNEAISYDNKAASPHINLANVYCMQGKFSKAVNSFKMALGINSSLIEAHNGLGFCYFELRNYDDAIDIFEKGIEIMRHPHLYAGLALAHYKKEKDKIAIYFLKKAINSDEKFLDTKWVHPKQTHALKSANELLNSIKQK